MGEENLDVKLKDIVDALEKIDSWQGYVDIKEGKVHMVGGEFSATDAEKILSEEERLKQVFEIEDQWQRYIALPSSYDIDERKIMIQFIDALIEKEAKVQLVSIMMGTGFLLRFVYCVKKFGLYENWRIYYRNELFCVARDWCEENNVSYIEK